MPHSYMEAVQDKRLVSSNRCSMPTVSFALKPVTQAASFASVASANGVQLEHGPVCERDEASRGGYQCNEGSVDVSHVWHTSATGADSSPGLSGSCGSADEIFPAWGFDTDSEVARIIDGCDDDTESGDSEPESRDATYWQWVFTQPFAAGF